MSNLSAAFAGASQDLYQLASLQAQKEMHEPMMARAETSAYQFADLETLPTFDPKPKTTPKAGRQRRPRAQA